MPHKIKTETVTPDEIYLFEVEDEMVWADTDESEDLSGRKYIRMDLLYEIKAQAIEEAVSEVMSTSNDDMVKAYANTMLHRANKLRGERIYKG